MLLENKMLLEEEHPYKRKKEKEETPKVIQWDTDNADEPLNLWPLWWIMRPCCKWVHQPNMQQTDCTDAVAIGQPKLNLLRTTTSRAMEGEKTSI